MRSPSARQARRTCLPAKLSEYRIRLRANDPRVEGCAHSGRIAGPAGEGRYSFKQPASNIRQDGSGLYKLINKLNCSPRPLSARAVQSVARRSHRERAGQSVAAGKPRTVFPAMRGVPLDPRHPGDQAWAVSRI